MAELTPPLAAPVAPPPASDAELIRESVTTPERFASVFDRHASALHRYVARRLGENAADDVVSECFLIAFDRRASFDTERLDARPWLYGIATRLIGRKRRDEVRLLRALSQASPPADSEPMDVQAIDRIAARAVRGQLLRALADLPAAHRDALLLVASGLSYEQTAAALGVPLGTVASRLARARRKVRAALGGTNPIDSAGD